MNLPAIPEIAGDVDILLDIYTHTSVRLHPLQMNEEYGDTDRLAALGAIALGFSITDYLCLLRPHLDTTAIQDRASDLQSDANIDMWLRVYRMKEKLLVAPGQAHVLNDPAEMRKYFLTFVGAVHFRNGLPAVQDWISALIDWSSSASNGVDDDHVNMDDNVEGDAV